MGLFDFDVNKVINGDAFQLGTHILANNTGHYGAAMPAITGGLLDYKQARNQVANAEAERLWQEQQRQWQLDEQKRKLEAFQRNQNYWKSQGLGEAPDIVRQNWAKNQFQSDTKPTADMLNFQYGQQNPEFLKYQNSKKNGFSFSTNPDGSISFMQGPGIGQTGQIPLTKSTNTKVQEDVLSAYDTLNRLDAVANDYQGDYLTYWGKGKGAATSVADKLGIPLGKDQKAFLANKTRFTNNVEQLFNQYRKEITGAAASVQELERLKKSLLNTDMSPTEFQAAYQQFKSIVESQLALKEQLLQQGITPGSRDWVSNLDRGYRHFKQNSTSNAEAVNWGDL